MVEHALYYPEWTIGDPVFLAESLLYWDRLACIVPEGFKPPPPWHEDEEIRQLLAEAHERFVTPVTPTQEQKKRAHERIKLFAEQEPPEWCRPDNLKPHHKQIISAYKFAPETVQLLRDRGWTKQFEHPNNLELQLIADAAADLVIGALADECCSPTMPTVTDDPGSFAANCNLLLQELGSPTGITSKVGVIQPPGISEESEFTFLLAKVPHLGFEYEQINANVIRRILHIREDPDIDQQRQAFKKKVDSYLAKLRTTEEPERQLIRDEFNQELTADLKRLQKDLQRAGHSRPSRQRRASLRSC